MPTPCNLRLWIFFALLSLLSRASGSVRPHGNLTNHTNCCSLLSSKLPGKILIPGNDNITASTKPYYSAQDEDLAPQCIVLPSSAIDVSETMKILSAGIEQSLDYCNFAIRSGGHSPGEGINNINGGVTINLMELNDVVLHNESAQVRVGPGNRWENVYSVLDPMNITVAGGRSRTVGVGGLTLSGGMSFFSPRYGMVCDNVINYEVVLANGKIVNANANCNADLYKALKGGSNNFGVVTGFDMRIIPSEGLWGGQAFYNASVLPDLLERFSAFDDSDSYDPFSQLTLLYGRSGNQSVVITHQHYTKPQPPPKTVFGSFEGLPIHTTFRVDSLTNFTIELQSVQDGGKVRKAFATATYKNNLEMLHRFHKLSETTMDELSPVTGLQFIVSMQPFGQIITSKSAQTGGNFLGLEAEDGDRVLVCLTVDWSNKTDDDIVEAAIRDLVEQANLFAQNINALDDYVFQNYAATWQDVYGSVGKKNHESFKEVSRRYDPSQLFQKAVPGGFKLV